MLFDVNEGSDDETSIVSIVSILFRGRSENNMYFYVIYIILLISFYVALIYKHERNKKTRKDKEILSIGKNRTISVMGIICIALILFYLALIAFKARGILRSFNIYFADIFKLFDIKYIESLMDYFTDDVMVVHLFEISSYRNLLFKGYMQIPMLLIIFAQMSYRESRENIIYEDGIMLEGRLWKWQELAGFKWSEKDNCKVIFSYESKLLLTKLHIKVKVKQEDREKINEILSKYLTIEEQMK